MSSAVVARPVADRPSSGSSPARRRRRVLLGFAVAAYLITFGLVLPILWIVLLSFQTSSNIVTNPLSFDGLNLANYVNTFTNLPLVTMYANTLLLAVVSVALGTLVSFMSSFALTRMVFRRKRLQSGLRMFLLAGLAIPVYILLFPIYRIELLLNLAGTYAALIIPYVAVQIPFNTLLFTGFLADLPSEIEEAAIVDGAGLFRLCFGVVMPIMKPVIATVLVFNVIYVFNEFPFASVLIQNPAMTTVSLAVSQFQGQYNIDYGGMMAAATIVLIPQLVIYALFQKQVVAGMAAGAVKG